MELSIPAIKGIGGSLLYFVDRYGDKGSIWDVDFVWTGERDPKPEKCGLYYLDHLTHNVQRGRMDHWAAWYQKLFNFRDIRFFNIEGKLTGLISRAMTSPCGKIRIPINEVARRQIADRGISPGISAARVFSMSRWAAATSMKASPSSRANGLPFMPAPPATYYEKIDERVPGHGEPHHHLKKNGILIDGEGVVNGGSTKVLLQIFSGTVLGPIFFEFIQRKGDDGFGEGNFRALFESIEEDQIRRGVLKEDAGNEDAQAFVPARTASWCPLRGHEEVWAISSRHLDVR